MVGWLIAAYQCLYQEYCILLMALRRSPVLHLVQRLSRNNFPGIFYMVLLTVQQYSTAHGRYHPNPFHNQKTSALWSGGRQTKAVIVFSHWEVFFLFCPLFDHGQRVMGNDLSIIIIIITLGLLLRCWQVDIKWPCMQQCLGRRFSLFFVALFFFGRRGRFPDAVPVPVPATSRFAINSAGGNLYPIYPLPFTGYTGSVHVGGVASGRVGSGRQPKAGYE